jgi:hypothetical protein
VLEIVEGEANGSTGCAAGGSSRDGRHAPRRQVSMGWPGGRKAGVDTPSMPSGRPRNDAGSMLPSDPS